VDGAREINQACVATGCFPGDGSGFPVVIGRSGSYIFTSNLDIRDEVNPENVTAIIVQPNDAFGVVIDLNGFFIHGPVFCGGTPPTECNPTGTGIGIKSTQLFLTIKNGNIFGMGDDGIQHTSGTKIENMHIENCGGDGIDGTGNGSVFLDNVIRRNGGNGITTGRHGLASGNLIHANIGIGLNAHVSMGFVNNVLSQNTGGELNGGANMGGNICSGTLCP